MKKELEEKFEELRQEISSTVLHAIERLNITEGERQDAHESMYHLLNPFNGRFNQYQIEIERIVTKRQ